jgi:hypothetical protein
MKLGTKTALGVDISESLISLALLKQSTKGIELLKAASAPVPDGAIKDGSIEEPEVLAKAIKELKSRNRTRARKAAVSLSTGFTIAHILAAPKGAPSNIRQFVQNELKSYIALSGKEITFDFCGIKSGQESGDRLLAVAADSRELAVLTRTCSRAGLDLEAVEPPILGYVRALFAERIEGRFDSDVLIAILHGSDLTLCVFRKQALDFVRVEDISGEKAEPGELCRWLAGEINAIIQFYDIEVADNSGKWEVTIVADGVQLPDDAATSLSANIASADLEVRTGENACQDTIVDQNSCEGKPSALAIGLAMGLLDTRQTALKINLLPPESAEVRSVKKQLTLTAVIIILAVPLLAFLSGKGFSLLADKVHKGIDSRKQTDESQDTMALVKEQRFLERQIELLSERPDGLKAIMSSRRTVDWAGILDDVKGRTPEAVRITALYNIGEDRMSLEGLALSYEAARLFVEKLNESDHIGLASLSEAMREKTAGGLITYTIDCSLADKKSES